MKKWKKPKCKTFFPTAICAGRYEFVPLQTGSFFMVQTMSFSQYKLLVSSRCETHETPWEARHLSGNAVSACGQLDINRPLLWLKTRPRCTTKPIYLAVCEIIRIFAPVRIGHAARATAGRTLHIEKCVCWTLCFWLLLNVGNSKITKQEHCRGRCYGQGII